MTLTIKDPLGLNGFGGTYRKVKPTLWTGEYEKVSKDDTRYKNDSLKSKRYFSRQEVVEKKLEKFLKVCLKEVKAKKLYLKTYNYSKKELFVEFARR